MSVQELSVIHRRYADLSDRFRAAWAFHQFIGSLKKVLEDGEQPEYPVDFQDVYSELKEVSQNLNASSTDMVREKLDQVDEQLSQLNEALLGEDSKVAPSTLRHFFLRVRNTSEKILTQLVKFYLYSYDGSGWDADRLDKVDYLVTRIVAEGQREGEGVAADRDATHQLLKGLWQLLGAEPPSPDAVAQQRQEITGIRTQAGQVEDLDDLNSRQLVPRYREIKHCLGALFFHPDVLMEILDTNLRLRQRIEELYHNEETRIFSDYQRIFDLEREVPPDADLDRELAQFRGEIEQFEQRLGQNELNLQDLARIRQRMDELMPRLRQGSEAPGSQGPGVASAAAELMALEAEEPPRQAEQDEMLGPYYAQLVEALEDTSFEASPQLVVVKPEIFPLRLEPREVVAYRRLAGSGLHNRELESFLLMGAALRLRLHEEVTEIRGILDDTATTGEAPVFARARESTRLADRFTRRYEHYVHQAVVDADMEEARELQFLRMRMMRDYSGVWLLAHKPLRSEQVRPG